jgi:L-lactate dehydrogenase (cytochrome)
MIRKNLHPDKFMGDLDTLTLNDEWLSSSKDQTNTRATSGDDNKKPSLETLISAHDFEVVASKTATKKAWAFYSSAATDLLTRDANKSCFDRIWFRPRVMRNVRSVNTRTNVMGVDTSLPLFTSPAAMAKLIHSEGECAIARACEKHGILQGVGMQRTELASSNKN